jgi:hypothetical protein
MHDKMDWYKIQEVHFRDYVECLAPLYKVLEEHTASTNQTDIFLKRSYLAFTGKRKKIGNPNKNRFPFIGY